MGVMQMFRWMTAIGLALALNAIAAERELKWDNGDCLTLHYWPSGEGKWSANDYDISTLKTLSHIKRIKVVSALDWPNHAWDGFRLGIFDFSAQFPGKLIWPESGTPKYVIGSGGPRPVWCEFDVDWVLPSGQRKFLVGVEQYYNQPGCDPIGLDSYQGVPDHSWYKQTSGWFRVPYYNLMVRVIVGDVDAVAPASLGRVKALYH